MRDRFDPLAPLLHQNHHHHRHHRSPMQAQLHQQQPSKPNNPFGNSFSNFSAAAQNSVGEKRTNCDENADCNLLQSSLKRVRLSRSPGEFRLQRDLKTLDAIQWGSSHVAANALNFSSTTWIHRSTGTRLTMMDSLRICLFLPITAMQASGQYTADIINPEQQYHHQLHSYHRDYRWRIMIQIPRMYPHSPPVVTQIDGLSLENIVISEKPPHQHPPTFSRNGRNESDGASINSTRGVTTFGSLLFTESQLARSQSSNTMSSTETQGTSSELSMLDGSGKTIEWKQWSPITGLGELLNFLLGAATSNLSSTTSGKNSGMGAAVVGTRKNDFQTSMAVQTARMSSSSSSSLSSVSSASSLSSRGNRNRENVRAFLHRNNTVADTSMMTDDNPAASSDDLSGASFLSPNRFDVGYGKSGFQFAPGTTPRTTNTTVSAWQQQHQREKQGEEDVGMDMS